MKKEERISMSELQGSLQKQLHYDDPDFAFEVLLYGWCKKRHHSTNWLSDVKKRGWMSMELAREFAAYCGYELV